jgi:hypothetical protein
MGTALQVGRSRFRLPVGSLRFFIHLILPAALGFDSTSNRNEYEGYFLGLKRPLRGALNLATVTCRLSGNSGILKLLVRKGPPHAGVTIALPSFKLFSDAV